MEKVRIEFISEGFRQILLSDGCKDVITEQTNGICDRANANNSRGGKGFQAEVIAGNYGGGRWLGFVSSTDRQSSAAESEDQALTRAIT